MVIKVTTWSPDTCGCVLQYDWDTDEIVDETHDRTIIAVNIVNRCAIHQLVPLDINELFPIVHEENTRKNLSLTELLAQMGVTVSETQFQWITDHCRWQFDDERNLFLYIRGVSLNQGRVNQIQNAIRNRCGVDSITVVLE